MGISIMIGNRIATGKKSGAGYSGPAPLIHYDFSRYSNENFLNNPDLLVKDLTGNGHDLKLYNFAFAGMSGFGGYSENYNEYYNFGTSYVTVTPTSFEVVGAYMGIHYLVALRQPREISSYKIKVSGVTEGHPLLYRYYTTDGTPTILELYNGIHVLPKSYINETDTQKVGFMGEGGFQIGVKVEQLPTYPGGLVSDGVDDYGQCIKGFALPDDYTVVALRKYIGEWKNFAGARLVQKKIYGHEAFTFEGQLQTILCSSYGQGHYFPVSILPALFSYQNKTSYNGQSLTPGNSIDDLSAPLRIFGDVNYVQVVLYDLRIYDHSLTDEELQLVKDDMMRNYEKYAKPLDGINYVCDFDAKGRSNDENADVRDKWIDKATGKVINLNNFAYAGMSGWGGYTQDITNWTTQGTDNTIEGNCYVFRTVRFAVNFLWKNPAVGQQRMKVRISGLKKLIDSGELSRIRLYANNISIIYDFFDDGDHDVSFNVPEDTSFLYLYAVNPNIETDIWQPLSSPVIVELLPLYPGALVSDGVDDYGVTREAINEEVGTMLAMLEADDDVKTGSYFFNCGKNENANRLYCWTPSDGIPKMGLPSKNIAFPVGVLTRTPSSPADIMYIASYSGSLPSKVALYRLILIREQLDNSQLEFLKWKVDKEYREWMKKNNYNINQ